MAVQQWYTLESHWDWRIIVLSWAVSFLGSWSTSVVMAQAISSRIRTARIAWILAASLCFGFGAIWSMHFVGMLAANIGVSITFEPWLTALSALLAVFFTFTAFATVSLIDFEPRRRRRSRGAKTDKSKDKGERERSLSQNSLFNRSVLRRPSLSPGNVDDEEAREPLLPRWSTDSRRSSAVSVGEGDATDFFQAAASMSKGSAAATSDTTLKLGTPIPAFASAATPPPMHFPQCATPQQMPTPPILKVTTPPNVNNGDAVTSSTPTAPDPRSTVPQRQSSGTTATSESSDSMLDSSSDATGSSSTSGVSWLDHLLSPAARARVKGADGLYQAENATQYFLRRLRAGTEPIYLSASMVYTGAIVGMHYVGMFALRSKDGELDIDWSPPWVIASVVIAFIDCFIACIILSEIEPSFGRQGTFALVASLGVTSMHFCGMRGATYRSSVPGDVATATFPIELTALVIIAAVSVSLVSNAVLGYTATLSRNRLAENVLIKRRAWRLIAQKEAAEQANALKSDFISTASHELRTPLHTVSGYTDLLMRTSLSEEQRLYLESIRRACATLNLMTRSVLDFSKLERGGEEHAMPEFVNLRECLESVAQLCEERQSALNVREQLAGDVQLLIDVDTAAPHAIYTDEVFLSRIVTNLLSNALKFCAVPGFVSCHVSYTEQSLVLVVSDSGIGISPKYLPHVFEPFTQADSSLTRRHAGTGLGLAICKQLVDRLKGTITVESAEGLGTTFTVRLPVDQVQPSLTISSTELAPTDGSNVLAVLCTDERSSSAVAAVWRRRGWVVQECATTDDVSVFDGATRIWADPQALEAHPTLLARLNESDDAVPTFVSYSDDQARSTYREIYGAPTVVSVRLPVIAHRIAEQLCNPEAHLRRNTTSKSLDRPKLVRFASSTGSSSEADTDQGTDATSVSQDRTSPAPSPVGAPQVGDSVVPDSPKLLVSPAPAAPAKPVILVAEDNPVNSKLIKRILDVLGFDPILAVNGQEAVDLCRSRDDIAVVLMDLHMPVLDGIQATKQIREMEQNGELSSRLPILALTANVSAESQAQSRDAGLDDFLTKPLRLSDLERALERHLHLARPVRLPPPA